LFLAVVLASQSVSAYTAGYSFSVTAVSPGHYTSIAVGNFNLNTDVTVGIYRTSVSDGVLFVPLSAITNNVIDFGVFFELQLFVEFRFDNTTLTLTTLGNPWRAQTPNGGLTTIQPAATSAYLAFSNAFTNSALSFNETTQGGSCSGNYYEHTVQQSVNGSVPYWTADLFNGLSTLAYNASFGITKVDTQTVVIDSLATNMGASPSGMILDANQSLTLCGIDTYSNGTYISNGQANCLPFNQSTSLEISCTDPGTSAGSQLLCTGVTLLSNYYITFASNFAGCN
jgi:hypothetical protein